MSLEGTEEEEETLETLPGAMAQAAAGQTRALSGGSLQNSRLKYLPVVLDDQLPIGSTT